MVYLNVNQNTYKAGNGENTHMTKQVKYQSIACCYLVLIPKCGKTIYLALQLLFFF